MPSTTEGPSPPRRPRRARGPRFDGRRAVVWLLVLLPLRMFVTHSAYALGALSVVGFLCCLRWPAKRRSA